MSAAQDKHIWKFLDTNFKQYDIPEEKSFPRAYYNRGCILAKLGRYDEALKYYDMTLRCCEKYYIDNPLVELSLYGKGCAYRHQGKITIARDFIRMALDRNPNNLLAWGEYLAIAEALGDKVLKNECTETINVLKRKPRSA